jgi:hypothetical protein
MNEDDITAFRVWLGNNTGLSKKVIGDTVSRLRRIEKIRPIDTGKDKDVDGFLFHLGKEPSFSGFSMSVKSQLRRACKLYYEHRMDR